MRKSSVTLCYLVLTLKHFRVRTGKDLQVSQDQAESVLFDRQAASQESLLKEQP